jgi:hypothetical protein
MKTAFLRAGDSIARGRIKSVALDHLDYERAGYVQRVEIGQNLLGQTAAGSGPSGPAPNVGVGGSSSPGVSAPAGSSGGGDEDIVEKLRRRRAAEGR